MKFGIKVEGTKILAISRFRDNKVPEGYEEIQKDKYNALIKEYVKDKHGTYEEGVFKAEKKVKKTKRKVDREARIESREKNREGAKLKELAKNLKTLGVSTSEIEKILL